MLLPVGAFALVLAACLVFCLVLFVWFFASCCCFFFYLFFFWNI